MHCLSSLVGKVNGWARFRGPGRLVRIGGGVGGEHGRNYG